MNAAARAGVASLPLHSGRAPPWLFGRMVRLAREILAHLVAEYGPEEVLRRLSDPFWFQAFGCVLGFDWHSSGVTTTVCGALKEAVRDRQADFGLYVAGGKGRTSRSTPAEITAACEVLQNALNRAKVDRSERVSALKRLAGFARQPDSLGSARHGREGAQFDSAAIGP